MCGTVLTFILQVKKREIFQQRLKNVRQLLTPPSSPPLDNRSLFNVFYDLAEDTSGSQLPGCGTSAADPESEETHPFGGTKSFMRNSSELIQC